MSDQPNKKFVHLRNQPSVISPALKRQAVLAVEQVDKDIHVLIKNLKEAQDFLSKQPKLSPQVRQKLEATVQKGTKDLGLYQAELTEMKDRLMVALR